MMIKYCVNIARPTPFVEDQNKRLCDYIEPLRERGEVEVSTAYQRNLNLLKEGKCCGHGPGYKYFFWFPRRELAEQFITDWGPELGLFGPHFLDWETVIIEVEYPS